MKTVPASVRDRLKDEIVRIVTEHQGLKTTQLAMEIVPVIVKERLIEISDYLPALIDECVKEGQLIEIEYVLPSLSYRTKSFLLPAGTKVVILKKEKHDY